MAERSAFTSSLLEPANGMLLLLVLLAATAAAAAADTATAAPQLFAMTSDVANVAGLVYTVANTVEKEPGMSPPDLDYAHGAVVFGAFPSPDHEGVYEVYCANTTGWEPLALGAGDQGPASGGGGLTHDSLTTKVYRTTTTDFVSYTPMVTALEFKNGTVGCLRDARVAVRRPDAGQPRVSGCGAFRLEHWPCRGR